MSPKTTGTAGVGARLPYLLAKLKAPRVLERLETTAARVVFALPAAAPDDASPVAGESDEAAAEDDGGISWPLSAVIALVVVIGAVAIPLSRRNRES